MRALRSEEVGISRRVVASGLAAAVLCACGSSGNQNNADAGPPLSNGFAGTWGGTLQTTFGAGGGIDATTAMFVTVSGNTASVSGVCPDGSGSQSFVGSGATASSPGAVTCPAIPVGDCQSVTFAFGDSDLALLDATHLELTVSGRATGCSVTNSFITKFEGSLAASGTDPVPGWDLRFKGVGESFVAVGGFGGGGIPGVPGDTFTWAGRGLIGWGLVAGGGFLVDSLYGAAQTALYENTLWVDGVNCPTTLAQAKAGNNVITAFDGDPYQVGALCIILAVGQPDGGPSFQYLSEEAVPLSQIQDELTDTPSGRSFVLTALFAVDGGLYSYIAESLGTLPDGGMEQFDTLIQTPLIADLATAAEALADAGYVITATAWQGEAIYTLVGTRPSGSTSSHGTVTMMTDDLTYFGEVQDMLKNGFVPVSLLQDYYTLPDGGLGADTWLIGER
jgi:hypothetical protein